jgi:predicted transglutaminase-like cysteine proteinase
MRRIIASTVCWVFATHVAAATYTFDDPDEYFAPASEWVIWRATLSRHTDELVRIDACVADATRCEGPMRSLRPVLIRGATLSTEDKLRLANRYINRRHYRNDRDWKTTVSVSDRQRNQWRSLLEFLEKGGDCEDYATAKYFLLRTLDVPANDLRIVVAWDRQARGYHALLAYRAEKGAWLLDTDGSIKRGMQQRMFRYVFSLNEVGIWDHDIKIS